MFFGLLVTGVTSSLFAFNGWIIPIANNGLAYYGLIGLAIALMLGGQLLIRKVSVLTSFSIFFAFAFVEGVLISTIFYVYTLPSIFFIFFISALLFLGLALYGFKTKRDLSGWRTFLFTAVIAVFISALVNLILRNELLSYIISAVALIVFSGLTVYDNQFYKKLYRELPSKERQRYVCLGALHMYINFI